MEAGLAQSFFGLGQLAPHPVQLRELIVRGTEPRLVGRIGQPLAGTLRFTQRVHPIAPELQDLRVAQQALTAVEHQLRLCGAPAGQRRGPLLSPPPVEDLLAARQHAAVDVAGHDRATPRPSSPRPWLHPAALRPQAAPAQTDQRPTLPMNAERHEVAVGESLSDRGGAGEGDRRGVAVAFA